METLWERATTLGEIPADVTQTPFSKTEWDFIIKYQPDLTLHGYLNLRDKAVIKPDDFIQSHPDDLNRLYRWYRYQEFSSITKALVDVIFGDSTTNSGEKPFILTEEDPLSEPLIMYDMNMGNITQVATIGQGIGMWITGVDPDLYFIDNLPHYKNVAYRLYYGLNPPQLKTNNYEDFYQTAQYYTDVELLDLFIPGEYFPFSYRQDLIQYCWNRLQNRN